MPPRQLDAQTEVLEKQLIETMMAGWEYPKSFSDWQHCARAAIRMFHIERRPIAVDLKYKEDKETQPPC